jgi:transcriptional regulator
MVSLTKPTSGLLRTAKLTSPRWTLHCLIQRSHASSTGPRASLNCQTTHHLPGRWGAPWTAEETARLDALKAQGLRECEIAAALSRTTQSIAQKWQRIHAPQSARYWRAEEEQRLLHMKREGATAREIAAVLGRSRDSVNRRSMLLRAGKPAPKASPSERRERWTLQEEQRLLELRASGLTALEMAKLLPGRTGGAVERKLSQFPDLPRLRARSWSKDEDDTLIRLRQEGKTWSEVAAALPSRTPVAAKMRAVLLMDRGHSLFHKSGRRWPNVPDEKLIRMREQGMTWKQIASAMQRSTGLCAEGGRFLRSEKTWLRRSVT